MRSLWDREKLKQNKNVFVFQDRQTNKQAKKQINCFSGWTNRQLDRQTDRQTNRHLDRQKDKQTDTQTDRQINKQTTTKHLFYFSGPKSGRTTRVRPALATTEWPAPLPFPCPSP
jgi:hypothetical protein